MIQQAFGGVNKNELVELVPAMLVGMRLNKDGEDQCAACHGNDHKGTRLSKAPVDRVFDFSDLDFAKLQAAGTEIGCDTCQ